MVPSPGTMPSARNFHPHAQIGEDPSRVALPSSRIALTRPLFHYRTGTCGRPPPRDGRPATKLTGIMFRIMFFQPRIPPNTGNAIRLAATPAASCI